MIISFRPKFEALTAAELTARRIDGPLFILLEDFRVLVDGLGEVVIPAGFETDWASIPALVRAYLDGDDPRILIPSLVHDFLYARRGWWDAFKPFLTRQECDDVLRRLMIDCGASALRARVVYLAVRAGGASHWPEAQPLAA